MNIPTPRVHRGAAAIARRVSEILGEPDFPETRIYQWRDAGKLRCFNIGPNVAIRDDTLIEDLSGGLAAT